MTGKEEVPPTSTAPQRKRSSTFWSRWVRPYIKAVTTSDWHFWASVGIFFILAALPLIEKVPHAPRAITTYESEASIADIAGITTAIASIQAAVAVALGTVILALPPGKFLDAINSVDPSTKRAPILDLAFLSYWTGMSAIASVVASTIAAIFIGSAPAISAVSLLVSCSSAACIALAAHALLQLLALLTTLLELAGIQHAFKAG